ncbi:MAG: hypothetical protein HKM24_04095 [Gammaproteobacteria bacterium]|nr:hypothetical protein [Gammaproteobacteria bacterium]
MKKVLLTTIATLMAAPVFASDFNYTYIDFGYVRADGAPDFDGFELEGSWGFGGNWVVDLDYIDGSQDITDWELGFGFHFPVDSGIDGIFRVNYEDFEVGTAEGDGFGLDLGLRGNLGDMMEWTAGHSFRDTEFDDGGPEVNDNFVYMGVQYNAANNFSYGVDVEMSNANLGDVYNIYGRYNF